MFNLMFFVYSLLFYFLYFFLGIGLTILIVPQRLRKYMMLVSPVVGYCLSSGLTWCFYRLNFGGTDDYYYLVILLALSILIVALARNRQKINSFFSQDLIIPILISIVVFIIISFPSLMHQDMNCLTIGNHDLVNFSSMSKNVKELSLGEYNLVGGLTGSLSSYWGVSSSIALFCSITRLDPYQVQMISLYIFFVIALLLTYVIAKEIFLYTNFGSNVIVMLFGLSSIFYSCIYNGFERQIIAVSVILLFFMSNILIIRSNSWRESFKYCPLLLLSFFGLFVTYDFMIMITYGVILTYVVLRFLIDRRIAFYWLIINIIFGIIYWISVFNVSHYASLVSGAYNDSIGGWFVRWVSLSELFGIVPFFKNVVSYQEIVSLIFVTFIIIWGLIKLCKLKRDVFYLSLSIFSSVFLIAFVVSYDSWGDGVFGSYYQMKLFTTFLPLLLLSSLCMFSHYTWITIKRSFIFGILFLLILFNSISAGLFIFQTNDQARFIYQETIELKQISDSIESVNISDGEAWRLLWEGYFLYPRKVYYERTQGDIIAGSSLIGEWSLIRNASMTSDIYINSVYSLRKTND
jgi:hypothetical protein